MKKFAICFWILVFALLTGCERRDKDAEAAGGSGTVSETNNIDANTGETDSEKEDYVDGGLHDSSDPNAPKEIESDEIVGFSARFFVFNDIGDSHGSLYYYKITSRDGVYILSETQRYKIETEISEEILTEVQKLIEKNNLVELNGIHTQTDGLPAEFQPCYVDVAYASGEILSFSQDGDPESQWMMDFRDYFNTVFAAAGY